MALPSIAPYPLPTAAEIPVCRAAWQLDPSRCALLVHDMQRYFAAAFGAENPTLSAVIANINTLRTLCAEAGIPVIYSAQPPRQEPRQRGLLTDLWGPGLRHDEDAQIVDALAPLPGDAVLNKWRYSAFQRTELATLLAAQGRDQLIIVGVYGHIGCLATADEAFMRDIQPFMVADAIADFSRADHEQALALVAKRSGMVLSTADCRAALGAETGLAAILEADLIELLEIDEPLPEDADLLDYGMDSLRLMSLVERWRSRGVEIDFGDLAEEPTMAAWTRILEERHDG